MEHTPDLQEPTVPSSRLTSTSRSAALAAMGDDAGLDILVIGGGVTGAGIALDAATRGLRVGIVEAQDWSAGTSSRSSRLVHGGLRYLYNLDFKLVAESLHERGLLLTTLAPHLVTAQPFLWPLRQPVVERSYSAVGVGMYDALSLLTNRRRTVPFQHHLTREGALAAFPDARGDKLVGAIRFYDARVDDARLVITLVRTAARYGALAASRAQVVDLPRDGSGRVTGAVVRDLETGQDITVRAREVINATGVWTEDVQDLAEAEGGLRVLTSKGIHIAVPRERIQGSTGMFLRTEKSVLFIIPWPDHWVIGTTDTPWQEDLAHPVATARDVDYLLDHANAVLTSNLTHEDVITTWAGLRPLLQPGTKDAARTAKVSREHTVARVAPGLSAIAGGKLTTYRVMAQDAVDFALGSRARTLPSVTATTPLVGADGFAATQRLAGRIGLRYGWDTTRMDHLLSRYGSAIDELLALVDDEPSLAEPLTSAPMYLRAEVAYAVTHEGALHLEDILNHRVRLAQTRHDRGVGALDEMAAIAAPLLGWDEARAEQEKDAYRAAAAAEDAAALEETDAAATATRRRGGDLVPMAPVG